MMKFFLNLCLFVLILIPRLINAQDVEYSRFETRDIDSNYILDYSDQLSVKIYGIIKSNRIAHVDDFTNQTVEYKPNENFNVGFGVGYKWFGLDLAFNILDANKDNEIFGKTSRFDVQTNLYLRKLVVDFNLQSYKGYYGSNPQDYKVGFNAQNPVYPIRPDMKSLNISLSGLYIFKHDKFSFRSAFTYNERQIKGTGSFLAGAYFGSFRMDADSTIVPSELRSSFNPEVDFRGTAYTVFGLNGGYAHNFVIGKRVFFSAMFALGLGPEITNKPALNGQPSSIKTKVTGRLALRTALGYNSERFFIGISTVGEALGGDDSESVLERSVTNTKLFIGKRFDPPKFLKRKG